MTIPNVFLIDIDGVVCAHAKAICDKINKEYGLNSSMKDVTTWDYDFGPITFTEAVEKYYPDNTFILHMEVTSGFQAFLRYIKRTMVVKFASNRKQHCHHSTQLWIKRYFGSDADVNFVKSKVRFSGFDYLLDDNPKEVVLAEKAGKTCFLLSRPWNNHSDIKTMLRSLKNAYFVSNFDEVLRIMKHKCLEPGQHFSHTT